MSPAPFLSVVIPVYNEEDVLPSLLARLRPVMDRIPGGAEAVLVSDGSRDRSFEILAAEAGKDPRIRVLELSRNFGHPAAITAGLDRTRGEVVVVMDADLQDPPELIETLVTHYRKGYDVVHARRSVRRDESSFKRATARLFYALMGLAAERPPEPAVGEFRLMSRDVVRALRGFGERHRLVRGLVAWLGFRQTTVDFERPGRAAGVSKYPFRRMLRLSWDAMTSFSVAPLRLATLLGVAALLAAAGTAGWALDAVYRLEAPLPPGLALAILDLLSVGLVLLCLGILGEYVGRIFEEVKGRPLYVIRREIGGNGVSNSG